MKEELRYRLMLPGEEEAVCGLVTRVFMEFVAPDYMQEGVDEFKKFVRPEVLASRLQTNHFTLVALCGGELAGMIEMRDCNHICLLFVDRRFQRRGVAKELLRRALEECVEKDHGLREIDVNSAPYSVPIYRRLGFTENGPEQTVNGIRFTPMKLELHRPEN